MSSKPLLPAAILSAATTVVATAVSERNPQLPDEPLALAGWAATDALVGTVAEPASWGLRPRTDAARATVVLHLLSGSAPFLAGTLRGAAVGGEIPVEP